MTATVLLAGAGAAIDARTRRIPNALTLSMAIVGLVLAATRVTGVTLSQSLMGMALGALLMLPGHLLGATGAGDVKLLGAAGAILGIGRVPSAFVWTAIAGGVIAVGAAVWRGRLKNTIGGAVRVVTAPGPGRAEVMATGSRNRFAYGPAIAIGAVLSALGM